MNQIPSMRKVKFEINGKSIEVEVQKIGSKIWYKMGSEVFAIDSEKTFASRRKDSTGLNTNQILSPMPGKITKVLIQVGEEVAAGQTLLVMEAMKMEYTLKSPGQRRIKKVLVKALDQVSLGQTLVEFELLQEVNRG